MLRATSTLLVVLLAGVLASAAWRMRLYQIAYGLTEHRLYVSVFMAWLTGVLAWLAAMVLRGRRRGFAFAATVDGLACIAVLHVLNPHALIARVNINRAASGAEIDGSYLRTLSADAVPTLIAKFARAAGGRALRSRGHAEGALVRRASRRVADVEPRRRAGAQAGGGVLGSRRLPCASEQVTPGRVLCTGPRGSTKQ